MRTMGMTDFAYWTSWGAWEVTLAFCQGHLVAIFGVWACYLSEAFLQGQVPMLCLNAALLFLCLFPNSFISLCLFSFPLFSSSCTCTCKTFHEFAFNISKSLIIFSYSCYYISSFAFCICFSACFSLFLVNFLCKEHPGIQTHIRTLMICRRPHPSI